MTTSHVQLAPTRGVVKGARHLGTDLVFSLVGLPIAVVQFVIAIVVVTGAATAFVTVGLLVLIPGLWAALLLADLERGRMAWLGVGIPRPVRVPRTGWRRLLDPVAWRAMAYDAVQSLWGFTTGVIVLSTLVTALGLIGSPILARTAEMRLWDDRPLTGWWVLAAVGMGVLLLALTLALARGANAVTVALARTLLGEDPARREAALSRRVASVERSRSDTVASVEAERRRIERDLHDGPQQRLVAVAMDLGMARAVVDDPSKVATILERAHEQSKAAIAEMRHVARGIAPPILSDRGLDAALVALASRAPVPVDVQSRQDPGVTGRPDATLEAIAYFSVSEALTNIAKHAHATAASVRIDDTGDRLWVQVRDDGVGGAGEAPDDPAAATGTGLRGLRQRVGAVDGTVHVSSPVGGPTVLTITLPITRRRSA